MGRIPSRTETYLSWLSLLLLAVIAAGILAKQARFNDAVLQLQPGPGLDGHAQVPAKATDGFFAGLAPHGLVALSAPEHFQAEDLAAKIDGKAEFYLDAGFLDLQCQRFALEGDSSQWLELFLYRMDSSKGAFAAFSGQRRGGAKPLAFSPLAYAAGNGIFLASGPFYVEVIAATEHPQLLEKAAGIARRLATILPGDAQPVAELDLLPPEGLQPESVVLLRKNVFGMQELEDVLVGRYHLGAGEVAVFLTLRSEEQEAAAVAQAYFDFLLASGGEPLPAPPNLSGGKVVDVLGFFEVILSPGRVVAGIHEAENLEVALTMAARIQQHLQGRRQ